MTTFKRTCPWCGAPFELVPGRRGRPQQFCQPAHQVAYNNMMIARGSRLAFLLQVWRGGRSGNAADKTASAEALAELCRLASEFNAEDAKTGRPKAVTLYHRRVAAGLI